jgi:hypothetical protein
MPIKDEIGSLKQTKEPAITTKAEHEHTNKE